MAERNRIFEALFRHLATKTGQGQQIIAREREICARMHGNHQQVYVGFLADRFTLATLQRRGDVVGPIGEPSAKP